MILALNRYSADKFYGFTQGDITASSFKTNSINCVIIIGFMHRVPADIRKKTLAQASRISKQYVIVSYSIDSYLQRQKHRFLKKVRLSHSSAPAPLTFKTIKNEFEASGLEVLKVFNVAVFFLLK